MKLYAGPLSMFAAKAHIAMREKGMDFELEMVPFSLKTLYEPKHEVVARVNPKGQVPVLVDGDLEIFDSTQIFEYLEDAVPEHPLWPTGPKERAMARQWELKSDEVFFPHVITLMSAIGDKAATQGIKDYYALLNDHVAGQDYIAGPYTYADIAFYMASFFAGFLGVPIGPELENLAAWRARVGARPAVRQVIEPMSAYLAENGLKAR